MYKCYWAQWKTLPLKDGVLDCHWKSATKPHRGEQSGNPVVNRTPEKVSQWYHWLGSGEMLIGGAYRLTPAQPCEAPEPRTRTWSVWHLCTTWEGGHRCSRSLPPEQRWWQYIWTDWHLTRRLLRASSLNTWPSVRACKKSWFLSHCVVDGSCLSMFSYAVLFRCMYQLIWIRYHFKVISRLKQDIYSSK
jgi:hypothetical protein